MGRRVALGQSSGQPRAGVTPLADRGGRRDAEGFGNFFRRQPGEEPQLYQLRLIGIRFR